MKRRPWAIILFAGLIVFAACHIAGNTGTPRTAPASRSSTNPPPVRAGTVPAKDWPVPRPNLTPGAVDCSNNCPIPRPQSQRNVPISEKRDIARAYRYSGPFSAVEFDHLVPFSLYGANSAQNVWPEPVATAHRKDELEDVIAAKVRLYARDPIHGMSLPFAQKLFLGDWRIAWCEYVKKPGVDCDF